MKIPVIRDVLETNTLGAQELQALFREAKVLVVNLMSSPGAGKTTLLERTLHDLKAEFSMGVIEGDLQTLNDAERIAGTGAAVVQINTQGGCHLNTALIQNALETFDLDSLDILFIENVGNLVCPAEFRLGEDFRITLLSLPEGDDKPEKYPPMFSLSQVMILNKADLLPYLDFDLERAIQGARALNKDLEVLTLSAGTGEGLGAWYAWLRERATGKRWAGTRN